MTLSGIPKEDDPPQSQISRSVCLKKGLTLCLFFPCSIRFYFLRMRLWETRAICIAMLINIMILFLFGFIYRPEVVLSSPPASASSSDNSLLEDPFSIKYILRYIFICVISCKKVHLKAHDHLVRETSYYCERDSGHSKKQWVHIQLLKA